MLPQSDWLRGVKRTPEEFDTLVLRIVQAKPGENFTARDLSGRLAKFNGGMRPDVNRVLRSMKRLAAGGRVSIYHYSRGWFNYYYVMFKNG